tara:strand:- start:117 stop:353 length:237 start_codon:yes stop_codon:yes gene_type:complete
MDTFNTDPSYLETEKVFKELAQKQKLIDQCREIIKNLEDENKKLKQVISEFSSQKSLFHKCADYLSKYEFRSPIKKRG